MELAMAVAQKATINFFVSISTLAFILAKNAKFSSKFVVIGCVKYGHQRTF